MTIFLLLKSFNGCTCLFGFFFGKVELYYMILERLGKYQEALDVIRGKLGGNFESFLKVFFSCLNMKNVYCGNFFLIQKHKDIKTLKKSLVIVLCSGLFCVVHLFLKNIFKLKIIRGFVTFKKCERFYPRSPAFYPLGSSLGTCSVYPSKDVSPSNPSFKPQIRTYCISPTDKS